MPGKPAKAKAQRRIRWGRIALLAALLVLLGGSGAVAYETYKAWQTLPSVQNLVALNATSEDSVVYDKFGQPVATLHGVVNRVNVPLDQISPNLQNALIATEDHNFYHNPGFDITSIIRAAIVDAIHRAPVQGASTITEQLAKDLYLNNRKTLQRKIQEFLIGLELARTYSKQQILDMYLNEVYFGDGATGIYAAAKAYFNETPDQLTIGQAALLAGLPQAPSLYDPYVNPKLARIRQGQVLGAMVKWHYITQAQATAAYHQPWHLQSGSAAAGTQSQMYPYPWYIDHVIHILAQKGYSMNEIFNGGLKIYTALDPTMYTIAQNAVDYWMNRNFGTSSLPVPNHQAAVVIEDPHTGNILAVIGGRTHVGAFPLNYATNRSVQRSTGSSIKPLIDYTPAIAKGYTEMSVVQDVPIFQNVDGQAWWPQNDDHIYRGYIDLRDALAISDNDAAVHLLHDIGLSYGFNYAVQHFGLPLVPSDMQLGAAIGGLKHGVNVLDMTQAYATFPNGGVRMRPVWITKVVNSAGAVVYQSTPQGTPEFSPQVAYVMNKMLERVLTPTMLPGIGPNAYATGANLGIGRPAAGKTGTNNNQADAWFMGYTPQLVVGVWEGNRQGEIPQPRTATGQPAYGAVAAGPIWRSIMEQINSQEHIPVEHFPKPSGIIYVPNISITSGLIAGPYTPAEDIQGGWFIRGTQPTAVGQTHYQARVVAANPQELWQPGCGPSVSSVFLKQESDWHTGVPLPYDAKYWAPTQTCTPAPSSATSSSTSSSSSSSSTPTSTSTSTSPPPSSSTPPSSSSTSSAAVPSTPVRLKGKA